MARTRAIISAATAQQALVRAVSPADAMRRQAQLMQAKRQAEIVQRLRSAGDERAAALGVQMTECSGTVFIEGPGEATQPVTFPVAFIERPTISGGWELVENQSTEVGNLPTCSVGVISWVTNKPDNVRTYWIGALLCIVSTGKDDQLLYAHWQMRGRALRNPIGSSSEVQ